MQRQPNEYWLKYMLLASGLSRDGIAESATLLGMIPPTSEYLARLREALAPNRPRSLDLRSPRAQAWLRGHKVISMVRNDAEVVAARSILGDPRLRSVAEPLLLTGARDSDVAAYISTITGVAVDGKAVAMFRHYFWNRGLLSLEQWYEYFEEHPNSKVLRACYNKPIEYALWKIGHRVELAQDDVLKAVFHEATMRIMETTTMSNNKDTALTAKLWGDTLFRSAEMLNRSGDGVREVLSELRDLSIQLGTRDVSSLSTIKGGTAALEHEDEE